MATARTPAAYVAALEPERRREFAKLRAFVRKNMSELPLAASRTLLGVAASLAAGEADA